MDIVLIIALAVAFVAVAIALVLVCLHIAGRDANDLITAITGRQGSAEAPRDKLDRKS